jgi:hypothetical protein
VGSRKDASAPVRDWDSDPSVVRARSLLADDRFQGAVKEAWKAANFAVLTDDERGYSVVRDLAGEIEARASGRTQRNAVVLGSYISHCQDTSAAGTRPASLFARLFGARPAQKTKTCPECAETVKAAARVCRFCDHRFDDG